MRKIFLTLTILALMLVSCTKDIESEANDHLKTMMREIVNRPDDATLINVQTAYKSDSLCVIHLTLQAPNGYGVMMKSPMEYIFIDVTINGERICAETITDLGDITMSYDELEEQSDEEKVQEQELSKKGYDRKYIISHTVADVKAKYRDLLIKYAPYEANATNIEDRITFSAAWLKMLAQGREVNMKKGEDIKL